MIKTEKARTETFKINDFGFRVILIPIFGVIIPILTGMLQHASFSNTRLGVSFLFTIFIAFAIWHGNRYLLFSVRNHFNWFNKPARKIIALLGSIMFYTIPLSIFLLACWFLIFMNGNIEWNKVFVATLVITICVLFITQVYETVFLVKESESGIVKNEQLARAKAEAELQALRNQVDPHFIFNSLNTLSYLIETDTVKAKKFNDCMADVYRYILQNRNQDLVLLTEELAFLSNYFVLIRIRYEDAVILRLEITPAETSQYLITPISLQPLIENAIKHNDFSDSNPLIITISAAKNNMIKVSNKVSPKFLIKPSLKTGLNNLSERFRLITDKAVAISSSADLFEVGLPLIVLDEL